MRKFLIPMMLALAAALSACQDSSLPAKPASSDIIAASKMARGFTVGSPTAAQTVYIYFDAQCPHCGELWESVKPLTSTVKMVWIPVGVLNAASVSQGAALLGSADPVQAMSAHEAELRTNRRGMKADYPTSEQRKVIETNTEVFNEIGGQGIPLIISRHAVSGQVVRQEGNAPTAQLRQLLGLSQ